MPRTARPAEGGGKRYPLNMRTTREIREQLEAAAAASGRSLAQEVEFRLEQSFRIDQAYAAEDAMRKLTAAMLDMARKYARGELPLPNEHGELERYPEAESYLKAKAGVSDEEEDAFRQRLIDAVGRGEQKRARGKPEEQVLAEMMFPEVEKDQ
jgi:hypothetical protein